MSNFARLNVYVSDSNVLQTEESADYTSSQLLSDIGGQLGLWVGISVITLAEVLELFMDVFRYVGSRHGPYRFVMEFKEFSGFKIFNGFEDLLMRIRKRLIT